MNDIESEISMANKMACGHHKHFHQNCILSWSHSSQHCPIFKELLPKQCHEIINDHVESGEDSKQICETNCNPVAKRINSRLMNDKKIRKSQASQA